VGAPGLAPDGRTIAAIYRDDATKASILMLLPVSGGEAKKLLRVREPESLDQRYVAWTPDGRGVLVGKRVMAEQGEIWVVPVDGGTPRKIDVGSTVWTGFGFEMHHDGRRIAFVAGENRSELWVLEDFIK
jgi:Tol biopolymer transport system component